MKNHEKLTVYFNHPGGPSNDAPKFSEKNEFYAMPPYTRVILCAVPGMHYLRNFFVPSG